MLYTESQRDSLRLYSGDVRIRTGSGKIGIMRRTGLWGDKDAYRTLNAFFFEGISNEKTRIYFEKNKLNPVFADQIEITMKIYTDILDMMCDYGKNHMLLPDHSITHQLTIGKRIERECSLATYEEMGTSSFISTSKCGFDSDFADKAGIVLLEFFKNGNIPFIDLEEVLGKEYFFSEEKEILISPFVEVSMSEMQLNVREKAIKDMHKNPPIGKYAIYVNGLLDIIPNQIDIESQEDLLSSVYSNRYVASNAISMMNNGKWDDDYTDYNGWKKNLRTYLHRYIKTRWTD